MKIISRIVQLRKQRLRASASDTSLGTTSM
jgi:hypothetical protein